MSFVTARAPRHNSGIPYEVAMRARTPWLLGLGAAALFACSGNDTKDTGGAPDATAPQDGAVPSSGRDGGVPTDPLQSVLMHHKNPSRDGVYIQPMLTKAAVTATFTKDPAFKGALPDPSDQVYAQPLFIDGGGAAKDLVLAVTAANNVYALDGATGAQVWKTNLGTPVPRSQMQCGNLDPFGVTGTPVVDLASRTMFLGALVSVNGAPKHRIFAVSIDTGAVASGWPIDAAAVAKAGAAMFPDSAQGQRGALTIVGDTVYVPYGGLYGDCGAYHGWLIGVSKSDPTKVSAWATPLQGGGAWAAGGVSSDGAHLFLATGNTFNANNNWGGGNAAIAFAPDALGAPSSYWAPTNWQALDDSDEDLGTGVVPFDLPGATPSALALVFGKDGNAYLLDRGSFGGVGKPLGVLKVSSSVILTAPAVYRTATATYAAFRGNGAACTGGTKGNLVTLKVVPGSPPTLAPSWCASSGSSSPFVTTPDGTTDAIVWSPGAEGNNQLNAFDGDTGAAIAYAGHTVAILGMRRFNTGIAAKGRIYVASDGAVVAFKL
jgi:hypothetical protein